MIPDKFLVDRSGNVDSRFIEDIINGMYDWVRVIDRNNNIIYVNKAMQEGLGYNPAGEKCYCAVGKNGPCEDCISRKSVFDGESHQKAEIINGRHFLVMSSPVRNSKGDIIAVVEVLHDITNIIDIQKKLLEQNKKLQNDLDLAKKLQCSLLPKNLPRDKINFAFIYKPCETLGGDFLDIFQIDEDHTGIYIADVAGHGVSASMLTVFLRSTINKKALLPSVALTDLYRKFNAYGFDQNLYITMFYAIIDHKKQTITYSNAGLNACPILFNKEKLVILRVPGIPISDWMQKPEYTDMTESLEAGDRIFFCTDGIIELKNDKNEQYGENRLLEILLHDDSEPSAVLNRIADSACSFAGSSDFLEISDDITMALLEIK